MESRSIGESRSILAALDEERRSLQRIGEVIEIAQNVTRIAAVDGSHRGVIYSSLCEESADRVIAQEIAHHRGLGAEFEWKLYAHDRPGDLLDRLKKFGFEIEPSEAVTVFDLAELGSRGGFEDHAGARHSFAAKAADAPPESPRVIRISEPGQIADFRFVAEKVFHKNFQFTSDQLAEGLKAGSTEHLGYIAYFEDQPVSIGRLYTHARSIFGGLYGGGTIPEFRGRGFYRAVVAARARDATALGAKYLIVDAKPTSEPILRRMGFVRISETWPCQWRP
jgi:hypothetical protein